ncbi:alpha/beta hydrolase [Microbacterium sp. JZ37]|uniref:alpha/beta fold hydrolase n=1 Tax=Microbacterium sp. JZ37 TaxID=2654193 RepID=UPI002B4632BF|nr:alpha/beta hydrolase [Microbacterium sp. JZ37]
MDPALAPVGQHAFGGRLERFRLLRRELFARRGLELDEHQVIRRDGSRIHLLSSGGGDDEVTVFVHGGVGNSAEWADVAPRVTGRVAIVDTPGFGLSDPLPSPIDDWGRACASWLLDVVDAIGAARVRLVGCSMGGFAAIRFAAAHPDRVTGLTLAGSAGGLFADIGLFLRLWTVPGVGKAVSRLPLRDPEAVRRRMFGPYVADPARIADDVLAVALAGVNLPGAREASRAVIRSVADARGWKPAARVDALLVAADVPTAFVWGDADIHASPDVARALAAQMSAARVVVVPAAGHIPHLDHPDAVADAIR